MNEQHVGVSSSPLGHRMVKRGLDADMPFLNCSDNRLQSLVTNDSPVQSFTSSPNDVLLSEVFPGNSGACQHMIDLHDESVRGIVMEQEESSDYEEEIEHVEFKCEEIDDSEEDELGCERPTEIQNKVNVMSTAKFSRTRIVKCYFAGIDIFTGKKHSVIVPGTHICEIPHVNCTDYQLIDISEDGFMNLLTENGGTKEDMRLPTDDSLLTLINDGFAEGKNLVLSVISAMGEEQVCGVKEIDSKVCGRKRSWRECDDSAQGEEHICGVKEIGPK